MPNVLDNAAAALQDHVDACTTVTFKSFPDYPIENADPFPMSVCYVIGGSFTFTNGTIHHHFPILRMEMHFSRVNIKKVYQDINAVLIELPKRLAGDPTLGGNVDTIVATRDNPITYTVTSFDFGKVMSQMVQIDIPIKTLQAPI